MKKRVQPHILEQILFSLMILFILSGIWIFITAVQRAIPFGNIAIFLLLIIVVLSVFMETIIMIRIYQK